MCGANCNSTCDISTGVCSCAVGMYFNASSVDCEPCSIECSDCTNSTGCSACAANFEIPAIPGDLCVEILPFPSPPNPSQTNSMPQIT